MSDRLCVVLFMARRVLVALLKLAFGTLTGLITLVGFAYVSMWLQEQGHWVILGKTLWAGLRLLLGVAVIAGIADELKKLYRQAVQECKGEHDARG